MELSERPKSRLADGRINPAYTAYRKAQKAQSSGELDSIESHKLDSVGSIPTPATISDPLTLRVVKLAPNTKFVLCGLDGKSVPVRIRRGIGPKLLKKSIRVTRQAAGTYHHTP